MFESPMMSKSMISHMCDKIFGPITGDIIIHWPNKYSNGFVVEIVGTKASFLMWATETNVVIWPHTVHTAQAINVDIYHPEGFDKARAEVESIIEAYHDIYWGKGNTATMAM